MELNLVSTGIELIGTTIKNISVINNIVDIEKESQKNFSININEPSFEIVDSGFFSQLTIDFKVEIEQLEAQQFKLEMALEGAFLSTDDIDEDRFKQLVAINGATAIIGIARGKIESITANIFNNGKISIPFVNVIEYYKNLSNDN